MFVKYKISYTLLTLFLIIITDNIENEELPDLDKIERELQMLDEEILKMAESNNINPEAVIASTETAVVSAVNMDTCK